MKIHSLLLSLVFAFTASAATFPASTAPLGDPPRSREVPELTAGRNGYLAAWRDTRNGESTLLAARVAANGEVIDATGITIVRTYAATKTVWNGERYLIFFAYGPNLVMRSIGEDGTVSAMQTVVANAFLDPMEPIDAATNGQRIVVAYAGDHLAWNIRARMHAAVLAMDGSVVENLLLDEERTDRLRPSIAINDSGFFVAWNRMVLNPALQLEGFALQAQRLDGRGVRLQQPRTVGRVGAPASLRANRDSFIGSSDYQGWFVSANLGFYSDAGDRPPGRFFTLDGAAAVIDQDHDPVSSASIPRYVEVVPYNAQGDFSDGKRILQATEDGMHNVAGASAVQRGDDVLVAWVTYHYGTSSRFRVFTVLASANTLMAKTEPRLLTRSATAQRFPSIASGANEALVTWSDDGDVYAGRVTSDGRQLDGAGLKLNERFVLHPPSAVLHEGRYAIAFTQWIGQQHAEVVIRFVSPLTGLSPDIVRIPAGEGQEVRLASGGGSLIVVWRDEGLHATRIHDTTYDPPVEVFPRWNAHDPVVSFNGTHFLIAWVDTYVDYDWFYDHAISGRRMTPELQFADAEPRTLVTFGFSRDHDEPALASNGTDWFLTWTNSASPYHGSPADEKQQVRIARIAPDGTADNILGTALARGFGAELAWTGSKLMMTWKDDALGNPLFVASVDHASTPRTLDPSAMIYEGSQTSITRWRDGWAAAYPIVGGSDVGHVPRVFVTFEGPAKPKRRVLR